MHLLYKIVLGLVILAAVLFGVTIFSSAVYLFMQSIIVPNALLAEPIFFDYTNESQPIARIDLFSSHRQWHYVSPDEYPLGVPMSLAKECQAGSEEDGSKRNLGSKRFLKRGTYYSVDIDVLLPKSPRNMNHGKFMIHAITYDNDYYPLAKSSRPVVIPYQSSIAVLLDTLTNYPLYLLGMGTLHENVVVSLNLMNDYLEASGHTTQYFEFSLSTADVDISSLTVTIMPSLYGLTYMMYYYPRASCLIGIFLLNIVQIGFLTAVAIAGWIYWIANRELAAEEVE